MHLAAFWLGIIQGLAEFLPISSSAHLILAPRFFHWPDPGLSFDVALHLGTLLALVIYYWKDLLRFAQAISNPANAALAAERRLAGQLGLATIPGALFGLALEHKAETVFRSPSLIAWTLIGLGTLLWLADTWSTGDHSLEDLSWKQAFLIGLSQALALIPGVSRSGITITMALFLGFRRPAAARFSFLLSIPIIAGAGLLKTRYILHAPDPVGIGIGFLAAACSGLVAIWLLLRYVQGHRYLPFVLYRWLLGGLILLNLARF
jgi:undecaprenyl-diphosphatase